MAEDEIEAMAVHFSGMKPDTGEIVSIGTLLLHPSGDAMVMGPDPEREISLAVILRCMEAAHYMCFQLVDDAPHQEKVLRYAVRAVLYQLLARLNPPDDMIDNGDASVSAVAVHSQRAHSELGASGMSRWSKCPASVALVRGLSNKPGAAAERGTACHEVAEAMLGKRLLLDRNNVLYGFVDDHPLSHYIGKVFNGIEVDEDLVETAQAYVNECLDILAPGDQVWIERQFTLDAIAPGMDMFGTADLVIYRPGLRRLIVIDLKSGAGIVVHAVGNPQLRYYALGAALSLPGVPIDDIDMYIVQPRVPEPVKRDTIDSLELLAWSADLLDLARATQAPDAPAVAGEHCRHCLGKRACITYELHALDAARDDFDVLEGEITVSMPDPAELSAEDLARRLDLIPMLKDWIKCMEAMAFQRLQRKDQIPGYKLVAKQSRRKWFSERDAINWLRNRGVPLKDIVKKVVVSPAEAEKLTRERDGFDLLFLRVGSGVTLVPDTDKRPAVTTISAEDDFDLIDDPN